MEPEYIIAIIVGSIFLLLLFIYNVISNNRKVNKDKLEKELDKAYAPANLKKMDYDLAYYDDDTAKRILNKKSVDEEQVTIDDIIAPFSASDESAENDDDELIGRYKP
ncbi:MAG: hypothetical protein E7370_01955 [Clostridiales bacterium]|nr:hypothetical protein [Clostridiales bacterium]